MCIEVYSTEQPVQIPFTHESITFTSPTSFRGRYIFLLRNAGYKPIQTLSLLFPRRVLHLLEEEGESATLGLPTFADITHELPGLRRDIQVDEKKGCLMMELADPNNPLYNLHNLPYLEGRWKQTDILELTMPSEVERHGARSNLIFRTLKFSAWNFRLEVPILPGHAHWFAWQIDVDGVGGELDDTLFGPVVFHEIASPIDVRRTVMENLHTALRDIERNRANTSEYNDSRQEFLSEQANAHHAILNGFGLLHERRVDIQYYELTLYPGNPQEMYLLHCFPQGDIRLRSRSPRIGSEKNRGYEPAGQPIYEWKSGSILEPAHPWKNSGFSLKLGLAISRKYLKKTRSKSGH